MGAGSSSIYREIHYIEVHYIKVWVYLYNLEKVLGMCKNCSSEKAFFLFWDGEDHSSRSKRNITTNYFLCWHFEKKSFLIQDFGSLLFETQFHCRTFFYKEIRRKTKILGSNFQHHLEKAFLSLPSYFITLLRK